MRDLRFFAHLPPCWRAGLGALWKIYKIFAKISPYPTIAHYIVMANLRRTLYFVSAGELLSTSSNRRFRNRIDSRETRWKTASFLVW